MDKDNHAMHFILGLTASFGMKWLRKYVTDQALNSELAASIAGWMASCLRCKVHKSICEEGLF